MLGVVNASGAGAGTLVPNYPLRTLLTTYDQKDSFYIMGPLLSYPVLESQLTSLVQEMLLVAQNSDDYQLQHHAAWAVSFLRHCLWFRELQNTNSSFPSKAAGQKSVSQNFPKDNVVMVLSLWLMHLNYPGVSEVNLVEGDGEFSKVVKMMQAKARLVQIGSIPPSELEKLKAYLLNTRSDGFWDVLVEVVAALQHVERSIKKQWLVDAVEISCALRFVGMLCGSCSKYMPLLVVDRHTVLSDLPVALSSLLSDSSWGLVVESVASYWWASTERIYDRAMRIAHSDDSPILQPIDKNENVSAFFLLEVMHRTCVSSKDYLPPEKQFKLANLVVP